MSQTPADESRPDGESGARGRSRRGPDASSRTRPMAMVATLWRLARQMLDSVARSVRPGPGATDRDDAGSDPSTLPQLVASPHGSDSRAEPSTPGFDSRDRLFVHPPDAGDANPPSPVGRVEDGQLTVQLPDEASTAIRSDVWERVER